MADTLRRFRLVLVCLVSLLLMQAYVASHARAADDCNGGTSGGSIVSGYESSDTAKMAGVKASIPIHTYADQQCNHNVGVEVWNSDTNYMAFGIIGLGSPDYTPHCIAFFGLDQSAFFVSSCLENASGTHPYEIVNANGNNSWAVNYNSHYYGSSDMSFSQANEAVVVSSRNFTNESLHAVFNSIKECDIHHTTGSVCSYSPGYFSVQRNNTLNGPNPWHWCPDSTHENAGVHQSC